MNGLTGVKTSKIIANNTVRYTDDRGEHIRLHNTDIISFINGKTVLNSGGWRTITTKERINRFLPYDSFIRQEKSVWYLHCDLKTYIFEDGITIGKRGKVTGYGKDVKALYKLNEQIKKYVAGYIKELFAGNVPEPSGGDCWFCCMKEAKTGKPVGGSDHLLEHMKEKYYVPSLLVNAINRFDVGALIKDTVARIWTGKEVSYHMQEISKEYLTRSLRRYMKSQLNLAG